MGRRVPQEPSAYTLEAFRQWTDRSRKNLGVEVLDLVQLHCPPTEVFSDDAVYDALDTLVAEQRIAAYGVSVETCAQAMTAIARPGTASVQIILNAFRQKPVEEVLPAAAAAGVAIIARVPLASGLLSGKYTHDSVFAEDDHRTYNRGGEAFDVGETFSGVDFGTGVDAAAAFAELLPEGIDAGSGGAALGHPAAGRHDGDPGGPQRRAGPRQRRGGGRSRAVAGGAWPRSPTCTTSASARRCTTAGDGGHGRATPGPGAASGRARWTGFRVRARNRVSFSTHHRVALRLPECPNSSVGRASPW